MKESFADAMTELLGPGEATALLDALNAPPRKSVRWNATRATTEHAGEPIAWCPEHGRWWSEPTPPGQTLDYAAGQYYIQEASAMLAAEAARRALDLAGLRVLDLCAAPGGKATQAAEYAGLLVANEVIRSRYDALLWNLARHRLPNVVSLSLPTERLAAMLPGWFDVVLCDAPCSGEGLFLKRKHSPDAWSHSQVQFCARRQQSILSDADRLLRPGGLLVYATCTFSREEDEDQAARLLDAGYTPEPFPAVAGLSPALSARADVQACCRRIWPHVQGAAGAFVCLLRKPDGPAEPDPPSAAHQTERLRRLLPQGAPVALPEDAGLYRTGDVLRACSLPNLPRCLAEADIGLALLRTGANPLWLHGCTAWPGSTLPLDEQQARAYVRGEDLRLPAPDGWTVVSHADEALGLVKVSANRWVNHFPKALRL